MGSEQKEITEAAPQTAGRGPKDLFFERAILAVVLCILVWGPLATGAVRAPDFVVIAGLTALALALWAARLYTQQSTRLLWPPLCWAVLVFLGYAVVRCQLAPIEFAAHDELLHVVVYAALFFVIVNNLTRRDSATIVSMTLIALALALAAFAIFQFATRFPKIWVWSKPAGYLARGSGTYINPNHLAGFLEMIVPLALAYTLLGRISTTVKVLLTYAAVVMLVGIGVTLSRGGIIATGLMLLVFCATLAFIRGYWLRAFVVLAVIGAVGVAFYGEISAAQRRFALAFNSAGKLDDGRFRYWDSAWKLYQRDVLWGIGPGHYDYEFALYRPPDVQTNPQYAHNDYLNTLCEWGITGMTIISAACLILYSGVFKTWPRVRKARNELGGSGSNKAAFVLGGSLGVFAMLLHSVVDFNMHIPANAIIAVSFMALLAAHWRFATERFWKNPGRTGKALAIIAVACAAGWLSTEAWRGQREWNSLKTANAETHSWDVKIASFKKAFELNPANYETAYCLGECYRTISWQGQSGYQTQAKEAMSWYDRAMTLNPYDPFSPLGYGRCLDWLDHPAEATHYFERAHQMDSNNYYVVAYEGWHSVNLDDYKTAQKQFQRSLDLQYNEMAAQYLEMVNERINTPGHLLMK